MKKYIKASTNSNQAKDFIYNCLVEYVSSGLTLDTNQLQKYPRDEWSERSKSIYEEQVYTQVAKFFKENFEGWFDDQSDKVAEAVWNSILSDPDFSENLVK